MTGFEVLGRASRTLLAAKQRTSVTFNYSLLQLEICNDRTSVLSPQELVVDVIKEELGNKTGMGQEVTNDWVIRKTVGGPLRYATLEDATFLIAERSPSIIFGAIVFLLFGISQQLRQKHLKPLFSKPSRASSCPQPILSDADMPCARAKGSDQRHARSFRTTCTGWRKSTGRR